MKATLKPIIIASAFLMAGAAHAATVTVNVGEEIQSNATKFSALEGSGTLSFSELLIGALDTAQIETSAAAPGVVNIDYSGDVAIVEAKAPVQSVTGEYDNTARTFAATKVSTLGGAKMVAPARLSSGKKNGASTGGELTVTNLTVDLTTKAIYADLIGANGLGTVTQAHVWNYANIEGATTFSTLPDGPKTSINKLTGLTITDAAFDQFAQALGLTAGLGIPSMKSITDYGVINAEITMTTTAVPEPSTYALVVSGLVAVAFAARRARRA